MKYPLSKKVIETLTNEPLLIHCHINPDGDTFGSMLGAYYFLSQFNPDVKLALSEHDIETLPTNIRQIFKDEIEALPADAYCNEINNHHVSSSLAGRVNLLVDFRPIERALHPEAIKMCKHKMVFDHHPFTPQEIADGAQLDDELNVVEAASTTQFLFHIFSEHFQKPIPTKTKSALLKGLLTDTGILQYSNTQQYDAFSTIATMLKDNDLNYQTIVDQITKTSFAVDKQKTKIKNHILENTKTNEINGYRIAVYVATDGLEYKAIDDMNRWNDMDLVITAQSQLNQYNEPIWKFSLRSPVINVRDICQKFGGNGHIPAAGFVLNQQIYPTLENVNSFINNKLFKEIKTLPPLQPTKTNSKLVK